VIYQVVENQNGVETTKYPACGVEEDHLKKKSTLVELLMK